MMGDLLRGMDHGGYYFFRHKAQHFPNLTPIMEVGDFLGGWILLALMMALILLIFLARGHARGVLIAAAGFAIAVGAVEALRHLIGGKRPEDAQSLVALDELARSFPARSVFLFTFLGVVFLYSVWPLVKSLALGFTLTAAVVLLVIWLSVSQLFLGLHFVTDVMAGLAGGTALALVCAQYLGNEQPQAMSGAAKG
jgi:undecaprenyl-diphosphatase